MKAFSVKGVRLGSVTIDHDADIGIVIGKIDQIGGPKLVRYCISSHRGLVSASRGMWRLR
jgi:hypothetical protein